MKEEVVGALRRKEGSEKEREGHYYPNVAGDSARCDKKVWDMGGCVAVNFSLRPLAAPPAGSSFSWIHTYEGPSVFRACLGPLSATAPIYVCTSSPFYSLLRASDYLAGDGAAEYTYGVCGDRESLKVGVK